MACDDKQTAFNAAMAAAQDKLTTGLARITEEAETKAQKVADEVSDGNDLAQGVGAAAGTVIGGVLGGGPGAVAGGNLGKTIGALFVLKVTMDRVGFVMDVPETTMRTQTWSFDSPVIVMKDKEMSFDTPVTVMKRIEGPKIPHSVCRMETRDGPFGTKFDVPVCYVEWEPSYLDVPTIEMRRQRIVIGLPEVKVVRQEFKLDVPEFTMKRQEFSFDIPRIVLEFAKDAGKKAADAALAIAQQAQAAAMQKQIGLREEMRLSVVQPATEMFACYRDQLDQGRKQVVAMFDPQIQQIGESLKALAAQGVAEASAEVTSLRESLDRIIKDRDVALAKLDEALKTLNEGAEKALDQFINKDPEEAGAAAVA